jgi:hypothetical protein
MGIKRFFTGGMNLDVAYEIMGPDDYVLGRNIVKGRTVTGKAGSIEPMLGTVSVDLGSITEAGHKCIGMCAYDPDNVLFMMFWHADPAKHKIIRYSPDGVRVPFKDASAAGATIVIPGDFTPFFSALDGVVFESRYYNKSVTTSISSITYSAPNNNTTIVFADSTGITSQNVDGVIRNTGKNYVNVITSSLLGFSENNLILNAKYVGGVLYFTDDGGEDARAIDVDRWAGSFTGGKPDIYLSKRSSAHAPGWKSSDESAVDGETIPDLLVGYDFQFAVQYVYENNMNSVVSPHSILFPSPVNGERRARVCLPILSSQVAAAVTDPVTTEVVSGYDTCPMTTPNKELVPETVSEINFLARVGNGGAWYLIDTVGRNAAGRFERNWTDFFNNEAGEVIGSRYSIPFDLVPIKPKAIELARNRLFLGNFFEGYDAPSTDVVGSVSNTSVSEDGNLLFDTQVYSLSVGFIRQMGTTPGNTWRSVGEYIRFAVQLSDSSYRFLDDTALQYSFGTRLIQYDGTSLQKITVSGDITTNIQAGDILYTDLEITETNSPFYKLNYGFFVKSVIGTTMGGDTEIETQIISGAAFNSTYDITGGSPVALYRVRPSDLVVNNALLESSPVSPTFYAFTGGTVAEGSWDLAGEFKKSDIRFGDPLDSGNLPVILAESDIGIEALAGLTSFGTNSSYRLGVVYKDWAMRAAGVSPGGLVDINSDEYVFNANISWSVSDDGSIPDWADYYSIVMTKNLRKLRFLEYHTADIYYLDVDGAKTHTYSEDNNSTVVDIENLLAAGKGYNFVPGDRIILYGVNGVSGAIFDVGIRSVEDGTKIVLANKDFGVATLTTEQAIRFEVYSPVFEGFDSLFYEVGQTYNIDRAGPSPVHSVKSGLLPGDSINVLRPMYIKSAGDVIVDLITPVNVYRAISSQDSKPEAVWNTSSGFAFAVDSIGQVLKDQYFRYSNQFIQDTRINGLNEFDPLNEEAMPVENGPIIGMRIAAKAQADGSVMIVVGRFNPSSVYLGETQFLDNTGQSITALTREVIGTVNSQVNERGCDNPESIFQMKGRVYWYNKDRNEFVRYTEGGAAPVSEGRVLSHFRKTSGRMLTFYDPFYDIMMMCAGSHSDGAAFRTIGWDVPQEDWRSYYPTILPDMAAHLVSNLYSASGKNLYRHDDPTAKYCEFYGVAGTAEIWMSFNDGPSEVKEWAAFSMKVSPSLINFSAPEPVFKDTDLAVVFVNPNGQQTDLIYTDFDIDEYVAYAPLFFDTLSSGGLMNGDDMVSASILARVSIKEDYLFQLYFFEMGIRESKGHNL